MGNLHWSRAAVVAAFACLLTASARTARAQMNTITTGIASSENASTPGRATAGSIDVAYVTSVGSSNAYIADSSGGIYMYKGSAAGQPFAGATVGTEITGLTNGSFYYYATPSEWEYEPVSSGATFTYTSIVPGTYSSIPSSFYLPQTIPDITANLASTSTAQGYRNELATVNNVTFTTVGTFASGNTYTVLDGGGNMLTVFVGSGAANNGLAGQTIPLGPVNVSGLLELYNGTAELNPLGAANIVAAPEPSTNAILAGGGMILWFIGRGAGRRRQRRATGRPCGSS